MNGQIKILIAEDNENARRLLEKLLREFFPDRNLVIFSGASLRICQQLANTRGPFRIGLVDLELEDSSPDATAEAIPSLRCQSLITMSGVASDEARRHTRRAGAHDYLEKPIIPEMLVNTVARLLAEGNDESGEMADIQRKVQRQLHQRVTAPVPIITTATSRFAKFTLAAAASVCVIAAFFIGSVQGAWQSAKSAGALEERVKNRDAEIDRKFAEIKQGNEKRDGMIDALGAILRRLEINQTKLLQKSGIEPERAN